MFGKQTFGLTEADEKRLMQEAEDEARANNHGQPVQSAYVIALYYAKVREFLRRNNRAQR